LLEHFKAELIPICHLLALLGTRHIFHVSGLRVEFSNQLWSLFFEAKKKKVDKNFFNP
jgi:hypothetical protein